MRVSDSSLNVAEAWLEMRLLRRARKAAVHFEQPTDEGHVGVDGHDLELLGV